MTKKGFCILKIKPSGKAHKMPLREGQEEMRSYEKALEIAGKLNTLSHLRGGSGSRYVVRLASYGMRLED